MPTLAEIKQFFLSNPSQQEIAAAMAAHPEVSLKDIAQAMQVNVVDVERVLNTGVNVPRNPMGGEPTGGTSRSNPYMGAGVLQTSHGGTSDGEGGGSPGTLDADPLINGRQFRTLFSVNEMADRASTGMVNPNDPDPLQAEIAALTRAGANPINHPIYGWIAEAGPAFDSVHDPNYAQNNESFMSKLFTLGPILLPAILTGSEALAGLNSMATGAVAGGLEAGGIGADFLPDALSYASDLGLQSVALPGVSGLPFTGVNDADLAMELGDLDPTTGLLPPPGTQPPAPVVDRTLPGTLPGTTVYPPGVITDPTTGLPITTPVTQVTNPIPGVIPPGGIPPPVTTPPVVNPNLWPEGTSDWVRAMFPAGLGPLWGNLSGAALGAYGSSQQADAYRDISREQIAAEQARYEDTVRREQERFGILRGRQDIEYQRQQQQIAEGKAVGAPYRGRLESLYADPTSFLSSPEVRVPVQQGTDIMARSLSAREGNPLGSGGALQQLQSYASDQLFGKLGQEKDRLGTLGGVANYNAAGASVPGIVTSLSGNPATQGFANVGDAAQNSAIQSEGNIWGQLGQATSNIFNPVRPGMTLAELQRLMGRR